MSKKKKEEERGRMMEGGKRRRIDGKVCNGMEGTRHYESFPSFIPLTKNDQLVVTFNWSFLMSSLSLSPSLSSLYHCPPLSLTSSSYPCLYFNYSLTASLCPSLCQSFSPHPPLILPSLAPIDSRVVNILTPSHPQPIRMLGPRRTPSRTPSRTLCRTPSRPRLSYLRGSPFPSSLTPFPSVF